MTDPKQRLALEVVGGDGKLVQLPAHGVLVIGSSKAKAGLVLEGQGVAEVHCAIGLTKDGQYALKDLGSEHGTLLNGQRVRSKRLAEGDQISLGSRRLKLLAADRAASAPQTPRPAETRKAPARKAPQLPSIPGYRLERPLGRGAMGEVYLAVQVSLDRKVAVKLLDKKLADNADFVRRFQAEARAAAALHHSNVVTIFDVGATRESHYLSMEYMDGGSLEDRLKRDGRVSRTEVLAILRDAASGLVYAESRGIVHRDIKPDNLMRNHQGATKIADLGLAIQVEAEGAEVNAGDRKIFGTPHFISPEQVRGDRADCRSDLYSLGATAYRLLSGKTPYEGDSTREILRAKLKGDPVPITERAPGLDDGVAAIVTRLMQRDPGDRYPSASSLLADIERLRAIDTAGGQLPTSGGGNKRIGMMVGGAVVLLAIIGFMAMGGGNATEDDDTGSGDPIDVAQGDPTQDGTDPLIDDDTAGAEDPGITGPGEANPGDDAAERLFEVEAENALLRLDSETLTDAERRDRLRELASTYAGTSSATEALDSADELESKIMLAQRADAQEGNAVANMMNLLREAAQLEKRPLRANDALRAMALVPNQETLAGVAPFETARAALELEVYTLAIADLEEDLVGADDAQARGDFAGVTTHLSAALSRTELPDFEEGTAPPAGAQRIIDLRVVIRERLDALGGERDAYVSAQLREDAASMASSLSGANGLEGDLRRFDFAGATARVVGLQTAVGSPEARAWLDALAVDIAGASRALPILEDNWSLWKRKSVPDPRGRRAANRDVVGVDNEGLRLDVDGAVQVVPWSAYAEHTTALAKLFHERLSRDYSAAERRDIAALLLLTAVVEGVATSEEMFIPGRNAKLSGREFGAIEEAFESIEDWLDDDEQRERWQRERTAAHSLSAGLLAASDERWAEAVVLLERLSLESAGSLLVRIYSDGTALAPPPKED